LSKKTLYRDLIYFNTDKVQSILAQLNKGVIESIVETKGNQNEVGGKLKTSKILEILGLPISAEGSYKYTRTNNLQNEKSLHDFALTQLLQMLKPKDASNYDRTNLTQNNDRTFAKVKGNFFINDYESLGDTVDTFNKVSELMDLSNEDDDVVNNFAEFIQKAYSGLTTAGIENKRGIQFIGSIEPEYLREKTKSMVYKYGGIPKGEWEMICQITNIPSNSMGSFNDTFSDFGANIRSLDKEKTLGGFMNDIVKEFTKINDLFASVTYPNIAVEPIAIYKEMHIG
jgi:hypothetical protein